METAAQVSVEGCCEGRGGGGTGPRGGRWSSLSPSARSGRVQAGGMLAYQYRRG